ncbi:SDR family NAD(P)-dependent oxidoreductase [Piscinibacter gummiphilus]|uniref:3-oxoacyl-ACP reductase n=1 Tax=Piscinibacter gummiphilus TaxID=946333 RepID=A0A1W6L5S1_9BURK|nr:SDR family oxidoreductase [Piscinibacter gummiphilus]ARN19604.1 3-oxoacyl-ACP reductase [Piscinibacter gummiphilus]ATU64273.1 NAD(P)-dependent oxidoreductase [Piscinibacter gummiphilus]GLS93472.1 dehydrogenase [Piscinibacter gummiphilus]
MKNSSAIYPSLAGRHIFITGGSSGIGGDMVAAFARQGARVSFVGRSASSAEKVVRACEGAAVQPHFIPVDLADVDALRAAFGEAIERSGDLDVLVNNAANDERHAFLEVTPEYFDQRVAINLKAHFFAAQAALPSMRRRGGGSVINVGSTSWKLKGAGYAAYATCKSAATGLTRSLAREFGPDSIRVNTLTPGWVMTERQLDRWVDEAGERAMDENHCLPGRILGSDVADLALFLAADESRMITAQEFVIDAGWT